jgi:photosystem II stability/assembly factor-like uncharacterized protein
VNESVEPFTICGRLDGKKRDDSSSNPQRLTGKPVGLFIFLSIPSSSDILLKSGSFLLSMGRLRTCLDLSCRRASVAHAVAVILLAFCGHEMAAQAPWTTVGPAGGDARAFAPVPGQPNHLYLGTTNSGVYESLDQGGSWHRMAKLDPAEDLVVDSIIVDSAHVSVIFAGGWKPDQRPGGLYVSRDGGMHWNAVEALRGQSIFSLAQSPSQANMIFAGTLEGVYRSADSGLSWTLISPPGSHEIHEVESLAIDPKDPDIVYAGTWHLPWKTSDGGEHWHSIKNGVIEDSDVFSMVIDPDKPHIVYLSACSGIYKSENAGELFHRVQGIPSSARRTRVLMQDPNNHEVVYAGTTEGLYKTVDAGKTFQPMTVPEMVVNDVYVDPADSNHVLLATDRGGVLTSNDAGVTFVPTNGGISGRHVEALLVDRNNPARLYAGVVNDKSYGGVFVSNDGGTSWEQVGEGPGGGLAGRDVFALAETQDGMVVAGTNHGIFVLDTSDRRNDETKQPPIQEAKTTTGGAQSTPSSSSETSSGDRPNDPDPPPGNLSSATGNPVWQPRNTIANTRIKVAIETHRGEHVDVEKRVADPTIELESRVNALDVSGDVWLASTGFGLLTSHDQGASWQGGQVMGSGDYLSVAVHDGQMVAARADGVVLSADFGVTWGPIGIPATLTRIHGVAFSADGTMWLGAREGLYFTHDQGKTWRWVGRLPFTDVDDLYYDAATNKVLVSSRISEQIFAIDPKSLTWKWWQTGYHIGLVRTAGQRVVAATLFDGVVVEPQAVGTQTGQK